MKHPKEQVLVIPATLATVLCPAAWGQPTPTLKEALWLSMSFRDREEAETNVQFKQVIPYIVVRHKDQYLVSQRTRQQQEARLHNLYSIGQGGHVTDQDFKPQPKLCEDPISAGLMRELHEEFTLAPEHGCTCIGLINDNSNEVGKVHFGLVYELWVSSSLLEIAETGKHTAQWMNGIGVRDYYDRMENWSKIVVDHVVRAA